MGSGVDGGGGVGAGLGSGVWPGLGGSGLEAGVRGSPTRVVKGDNP